MVQNDMSNKKVGNCIKASTCSVYSTPWPHSTAGTPTKTRSHHLTQLTTPPAQPPHSDTLSNAFILHRNPEEMVGLGWSKPPPPSTCQVISNWFWTHAQPQRLHLGELTTTSQKSYTFYVTCYCEMDRRGNKWSWINHNGRKLQRILTRGEAKHTELYSDPLQAYKRRTFNSAALPCQGDLHFCVSAASQGKNGPWLWWTFGRQPILRLTAELSSNALQLKKTAHVHSLVSCPQML